MIVNVNVTILRLIIRFRDVCFMSFKNGFWKLSMQSLKMEKEKTAEGIKFSYILLNLIWVFSE